MNNKFMHHKHLHMDNKDFIIEGPVNSESLKHLTFHKDMNAFRQAPSQQAALTKVASLPEGRIIIARQNNLVVGYIAITFPDEIEYWSRGQMKELLELGAIEVAAPFRNLGLAKEMLRVTFMDSSLENFIVITTLYYWHWDLKTTGLNVWQYQEMMKKVMGAFRFDVYSTNDPEIQSDPANLLLARIGKNVPKLSIAIFDALRCGQIK